MIVTTEAIVLRARKQGETSKIVTLYTRGFGKLNVIAKGAREMKSKFGGALEMFARSTVVFYKREKQDALNLLSKAETLDSNAGIMQSLKKMEAAMAIVELMLHAMHDEEANEELFDLLAGTLHTIARSEEREAPFLQLRFYLRFLKQVGFEIDVRESSEFSPHLLELLRWLEEEPAETSAEPGEKEFRQLHSFFQAYFAEHVPGMSLRSMKSANVFGQL
ncbi:MAG TPA: DNA repair protein RecO [Candidatus Kapabacteria bacterium]|nr:DNA repair protein RecO [Candidatus Kapabacteria bacterium]